MHQSANPSEGYRILQAPSFAPQPKYRYGSLLDTHLTNAAESNLLLSNDSMPKCEDSAL
jgi:hypothetical protein